MKIYLEFNVEARVSPSNISDKEILELADYIRHDLEKVHIGNEKQLMIEKVNVRLKNKNMGPYE